MDVWEARSVLGVAEGDDWPVVRAAYRRLIRVAHPDTAGRGATRRAARLNEAYAVLSRAKRSGTLTGSRSATDTSQTARPGRHDGHTTGRRPAGEGATGRHGPGEPSTHERPVDGRAAGGGASRAAAPPATGVTVAGTDTLLLAAPPPVAFVWLLEAAHGLGAVSYVDRSCGIFEVIVRVDGDRLNAGPRDTSHQRDGVGETCSLLVMVEARSHGSEAVLAVESLERAASHSPEPFLRQLAAALGG